MKKRSRRSPSQKGAALLQQSLPRSKSKVKQAVVNAAPVRATQSTGVLLHRIVAILETARDRVVCAVNSEMVLAYWHIGREIVEHLQAGARRAEYGEEFLETLAAELNRRFGRGFSATNLRYFRLFYQAFAEREPRIRHEARDESAAQLRIHHEARDESGAWGHRRRNPSRGAQDLAMAVAAPADLRGFSDRLGWTHYRALAKVANEAARRFYEIEAEREGWSATHMERQIDTQLFVRLLKSRDRQGVLDLAARGQVIERPVDLLKNPYVLDFLDLPDSEVLHENDLESAILSKLQQFLLELGKGFAFVARQRRITFDDESFYVDLVFYNCELKCYLLIDLKLGKLTHQDVGQMDSYVRLFDEQCTAQGDAPTIGLILCAEKNEAVARYSVLHENKQLFAAKYLTYLPSVEELQHELRQERRAIEARGVGAHGVQGNKP